MFFVVSFDSKVERMLSSPLSSYVAVAVELCVCAALSDDGEALSCAVVLAAAVALVPLAVAVASGSVAFSDHHQTLSSCAVGQAPVKPGPKD